MRLPARLALGLIGSATLTAAPTWRQVETDQVRVISDAAQRDLLDFAVKYSAFRTAFNTILVRGARVPPRSTVILFNHLYDLRHYASPPQQKALFSYAIDVDGSELVAFSVEGDRTAALSLAVESDTISLLQRTGYFLPLWMSQGTGEVFGSLILAHGECVLGEDLPRLSRVWAGSPSLSWKRFFQIYSNSPEYSGDAANGVYQAQAWALMHAVLLGGEPGSPRERFQRLAESASLAADPTAAVAEVTGAAPGDFLNLIRHNLDRTMKVPFDEAGLRAHLTPAPAAVAEAKVYLAELLVSSGKLADSDQQLADAQALAPTAPYVKEALARRELRRGNAAEAARLYREAIAAGSTNAVSYLASAKDRIDQSGSSAIDHEGGGGSNITDAIEEIHHALQLAPGSVRAYVLLGRAYFVAPAVTAADLDELKPALNAEGDGVRVRYYRALLNARLNRPDDSLADLHQIVADPSTPEKLRNQAQDHLMQVRFDLDRKAVEGLVREQKFSDALAMVASARQRATDPGDPQEYGKLAVWVSDSQEQANFKDLYHGQRWADLRAAAESYRTAQPHGRLAPLAAKMISIADQKLTR